MPLYLSNRDGNGKTSEEGHYRLQTKILTGDVLQPTSLLVSQSSPLAMTVNVAAGDYKVDATEGYSYTGWSSESLTVPISTADPSNPRISTVVLYIDRSAPTSASPPNNPGIPKLAVINGSPSAVPFAPSSGAIQANIGASNPFIILADVRVNAGVSSIANANITDRRVRLYVGNNMVATSSIQDGAIIGNKIPDQGIATSKIANLGVTTPKIADNAVTSAKIETQQSWITPTMTNGWIVYDTTYQQPGYMKDSLGFVHLKGLIKGGTGQVIFTLPTGYRPTKRYLFITASNNTYGRIDVDPSGQVIANVYSSTWISMDPIYFKAEQ